MIEFNTDELDKLIAKEDELETEIDVGVFDPLQVDKAVDLEYGDPSNNQPERKVFRSAYSNKSRTSYKETRNQIIDYVDRFFEGRDLDKEDLATELAAILQEHIDNQDFPKTIEALKETTIRLKNLRGSSTPEKIGIDTGDMVDSIKGIVRK